jgi:DNA polymerase-1
MKTTLLVDSDIVAFKIASVNEQKFNWGDDIVSKVVNDDFNDIKKQVKECLDSYLEATNSDELIVCLSDDKVNWRNSVLPSYKMHRKEGMDKRPEWLYPLKEHLATAYESYRRPTMEADDILGILATHPKLISGKKIICSEDKDLKTIGGYLYNPRKDTSERFVSETEANLYHFRQSLTGDPTDGYKGCPGAGDKAFDKLLLDWEEGDWVTLWNRIVSVYEAKGLTEFDAITQARVARICRHTEYDFKLGKVILWQPPK